MNAPSKIDMLAALRLTREGRLDEAMSAIRKALSTSPSTGAPSDAAPPPPPSAGPGASRFSLGETLGGLAQRIGHMRPTQGLAPLQGLPTGLPKGLPTGLSKGLPKLDGLADLEDILPPARGRARVPLPDGSRFEQRSFANAAGSRAYKLFVPSGYKGQPLPLVVMLHGCTQSPDDFAAGTRMNELAEEQTFLVAYPAQSRSANVGKCWNWFNEEDQRRDRGEASLIAGITREIMQDFTVEPGCVYIAGLSAGGAAAASMGSVYPDLYAAIGVHSGLPHGAASDMASGFAAMKQGMKQGPQRDGSLTFVPAIVFHGDRDTTVHPVNGDAILAQAKARPALSATVIGGVGAGGREYTRTVHADANGRSMAEHWVLHGSGHAWSGGSAAGSFTDPRGPDASREMMRFFAQHRTA